MTCQIATRIAPQNAAMCTSTCLLIFSWDSNALVLPGPHGSHRVGCVTRRSPSCFELFFRQAQTGAESPTRTLNIATSMKSRRRLLTMQNGRAAATMFNLFTELSQLFVSKTSQVSIRASTLPDLGVFWSHEDGSAHHRLF